MLSVQKHLNYLLLAVTCGFLFTACGGDDSSNTAVIAPPAVTTQPVSATVASGTSTTLSVVATGESLSYQWYRDGTAVSGATSATYTAAVAGSYYVVVTNSAGAAQSSAATLTVTVSSGGTNTADVVSAANAFLATLSSTQKTVATSSTSATTVLFQYTLANAIQWSNLPGGRHGLRLNTATLSEAQLTAANAVIAAALGTAGQIMMAEVRLSDDVVAASQANSSSGSGLYSIAFIGTPSVTNPWLLQLTGHNLAYNITYNAMVSATPMFIGAEPPNWTVNTNGSYTISNNASSSGTAHAPLETQRQAMFNLAEAIQADASTAAVGKLTGTFSDVVMGVSNNGDSNFKTLTYPTFARGVSYTSLGTSQKTLVKTAIRAWVNTQASDIASTLLGIYESDAHLNATYIGYAVGRNGTKADFGAYPNAQANPLESENSYIRIDGPRVWIEFVVQAGVAYPGYVHYNSLWRDKIADYGGSF